MSKELLQTMSKDLQIFRFENEDDVMFEGRLLYSAIAAWCRNMVKDKSFQDVVNNERKIGVDVEHISIRLSQVIDGMFDVFPYGKEYFQKNEETIKNSKSIASEIIKELIFSYECSKALDERNICETPNRNIVFSESSVLSLGGTDYKSCGKYYFVGCGKWLTNLSNDELTDSYDFWGIPKNNSNYLTQLTQHADWREADVDKSYQILDITKDKLKIYGTGWSAFSKGKIKFPLEIIKRDNRFYILHEDEDCIQIAEINKWYLDENEIYRIIFAVKNKYHIASQMRVEKCEEYVVVAFDIKLPNPEMRILLLSSWGYNNAFDKYSRIVPIKVWQAIKPLFENLGLNILYK